MVYINTHGKGERVKIPLLPNNVGKKSVNDSGPRQGHDKVQTLLKAFEFQFQIRNSSIQNPEIVKIPDFLRI